MVVQHPVQIVIASDVESHAVLVQQKHIATRRRWCGNTRRTFRFDPAGSHASPSCDAGPVGSNVDRVAGIQLEETPDRPTTKRVPYEAFLTLQEGHLVGHAELIGVPVIESGPAIRK